MGKKGASKKLSSKNNDRGILGIKKAIVRKGDTVIGSATPSVHSGRTRLPQSEVFLEQVQEDAARVRCPLPGSAPNPRAVRCEPGLTSPAVRSAVRAHQGPVARQAEEAPRNGDPRAGNYYAPPTIT